MIVDIPADLIRDIRLARNGTEALVVLEDIEELIDRAEREAAVAKATRKAEAA